MAAQLRLHHNQQTRPNTREEPQGSAHDDTARYSNRGTMRGSSANAERSSLAPWARQSPLKRHDGTTATAE
jgi:hypothetical protein